MKDKDISQLAKVLGSRGGKARAKKLTNEELSKIGKIGAKKRWGKNGKGKEAVPHA